MSFFYFQDTAVRNFGITTLLLFGLSCSVCWLCCVFCYDDSDEVSVKPSFLVVVVGCKSCFWFSRMLSAGPTPLGISLWAEAVAARGQGREGSARGSNSSEKQ